MARAPPAARPKESTAALLHELHVHQIELELQNEELFRNQLELEGAHDRLMDLYEFAPVGYVTLDGNGVVTGVNLTAAGLLRRERKRLMGLRFSALIASSDADRWQLFFKALVRTDERRACRLALTTGDGTFDALLACERREGGPTGAQVRVVLTDVTGLAQAEKALRESERLLGMSRDLLATEEAVSRALRFAQATIDALPEHICVLDREGIILTVNTAWRDFADANGAAGIDFVGTSYLDVCRKATGPGAEQADSFLAGLVEIQANRSRSFAFEYPCHSPGEERWFEARVTGFGGDDRGRVVVSHSDITARRRAEERSREAGERMRSIVTAMAEGVVLQDASGKIVLCNAAAERILGLTFEQMAARTSVDPRWRSIREDGSPFPGEEHPAMRALRAGEPVSNVVMGIHKPDGTLTWILVNAELLRRETGAAPYAVVTTFIDVTGRKKAEAALALAHQQVVLTSRLAALGTLVAGLAHEVNNPLVGVLAGQGVAKEVVTEIREQLQGSAPLDRAGMVRDIDDAADAMDDADAGAQRVARIVRDLAVFAHPDPKRTRVRLADAVEEAVRWLKASAYLAATVTVENAGAPDISAAAGQIVQVITDLLVNAAKAATDGNRARILIRAGPGAPGMARLEVIDEGAGIAADHLDRVFDPFFTTRPTGDGRGTGLGLSICHAIVTAHGGTLTVESELGKGSTFRVELPAAQRSPR